MTHGNPNMFGSSPFNSDEAFLSFRKSGLVPDLCVENNSDEALNIRNYRALVYERYAGNWMDFFLDWRCETKQLQMRQEETHKKIQKQQQEHQAVIMNQLYEQNRKLEVYNLELQEKLSFLVKEAEYTKQEREEIISVKLKRQLARKLPVRDSLTWEDFETVLELVKGDGYVACRTRIALILLYYTGLRVSNLLLMKVFHYEELLSNRETTLPLIKKGSQKHFLNIGSDGAAFLSNYKSDMQVLLKNREREDFIFTAIPVKESNKVISLGRESFDRDLNRVLIQASNLLGKHFRTHSFRTSFITDLLATGVAIHDVKDVIGHRDIKSTYSYNRSFVTQKETRAIMNMVNKNRKKNFKIPATTKSRPKAIYDIIEISQKDTVADQKDILINPEPHGNEDNEKNKNIVHNDE